MVFFSLLLLLLLFASSGAASFPTTTILFELQWMDHENCAARHIYMFALYFHERKYRLSLCMTIAVIHLGL